MRWRFFAVLAPFLLVAACGGRSIRHGDGGEAGDDPDGTGAIGATTGGTTGGRNTTGGTGMGALGGTGGTGGTGMGALGGTGGTGMGAVGGTGDKGGTTGGVPVNPPQYCEFNGRILSFGETAEDPRFCLSCTCASGGRLDCTQCDVTCRVSAVDIKVGQNQLMPDGCTNCVCTVNGMDCDGSACATPDPCRDLMKEYELAVGAQRWCGPDFGNFTCTTALRAKETIPCGCNVLVRSLEPIYPIENAYIDLGCPPPTNCEQMCEEPRAPYRCGEAGFCVGAI
jgi:hypothetical protein